MNAVSNLARTETQSLTERYLRDLVKVHLANKARCLAAAEAFARCEPGSREEFARAEDAQESSYSDLACTIEDLFCVSADELWRALS